MNLVPYYTEEELMDRSKGDILSKGVALLQTAWFVTQYFTRMCYRLPLTKLETITPAFAVLNFATYILWLHKPLNVQCPIRVHEQPSALSIIQPESRTRLYDHHIRSESPTSLDSQLQIPVFTFDDIVDGANPAEWEELRETPWFYDDIPTNDGTAVSGSPSSGSQTLASTPSPATKEPVKSDVDGFPHQGVRGVEFSEKDGWGEPNEIPWFPNPEVLLATHRDETSVMGHRTRRTGSIHSHHNQVRWSYKLPRQCWRSLPRGMIIFTIDGGRYTIHISRGLIPDDDLTSFDTRNNPLSVDFYVPLFLRNRSWALQMWIVLPFWLPYIIFVALYSCGLYPFFVFLLHPLASMAETSQISQEPWLDPRYPLQVPAFFAGPISLLDVNSRLRIWYTLFFLASIFGSVHALGWSAYFPSTVERMLWRISTLTICGVPPTIALWVAYRRSSFPQLRANTARGWAQPRIMLKTDLYRILGFLAAWPAKIGMPMYILGRIVLIALAFASLRGLPQETFQSVPWTSAIPHL
ncbi:hypothetical protein P691DRAFT_766169 [Macrolepiota fuliginosa MF-IS2]|uniref:Uncharacterized protein n=1 Tax=Macrolepiota fuliginosa MF-IS2 TaxID=1400762 RepID=A0A9P5X037_9AGAR|nr:hypothetical protein P691DRAFT_766169 [Macrolepiota fuliginosa MF-IS2]